MDAKVEKPIDDDIVQRKWRRHSGGKRKRETYKIE